MPQPSVAAQQVICQVSVESSLGRSWAVAGAGAEGAVQKDQQFCLHLAARVTLPEEISAVHEPRERSASCHAAGEPLAAETRGRASLQQNARNGRTRKKSQAKRPCPYQKLCKLRLTFSLAGRGGCPAGTEQRWLLVCRNSTEAAWGLYRQISGMNLGSHSSAVSAIHCSEWNHCAVIQL